MNCGSVEMMDEFEIYGSAVFSVVLCSVLDAGGKLLKLKSFYHPKIFSELESRGEPITSEGET